MSFKEMFDDQRAFNQQIWKPTAETTGRWEDRLRVLSIGLVEETLEFLRTFEWKTHRRRTGKLQNISHSHEELIDAFKYWLSLADLADFPIDQLEELYYAKSRVVQYRYQEEWLKEIDDPCVLIDIDNVLADYITGFCHWAKQFAPTILQLQNVAAIRLVHRLDDIQTHGRYINAEAVGIRQPEWDKVKHLFRTQGGKRTLPTFDDTRPFLDWCRQRHWTIILVTSRPIDRYPNIFTDTLTWLHTANLPYDYVWWAEDKVRRLEESNHVNIRSHVQFAVDDDAKFVGQYSVKGIKTYWLNRHREEYDIHTPDNVTQVESLMQIMEQEGDGDGRLR